jgi:hypothetical protein
MPTRSTGEYLTLAENILLDKTTFSSDREGRVRQLLKAAEVAASLQPTKGIQYESESERRAFDGFLRTGKFETRDMGAGGGTYPNSAGSALVPVGFRNQVVDQLAPS